jgi:hypothetical protein
MCYSTCDGCDKAFTASSIISCRDQLLHHSSVAGISFFVTHQLQGSASFSTVFVTQSVVVTQQLQGSDDGARSEAPHGISMLVRRVDKAVPRKGGVATWDADHSKDTSSEDTDPWYWLRQPKIKKLHSELKLSKAPCLSGFSIQVRTLMLCIQGLLRVDIAH